jgi:hypothetical protein
MELSDIYRAALPDEYAQQMGYVDKLLPRWRIPGTVFTSIYGINFPTAVHVDKFDIPEGTGVMTTAGEFAGNEYCLPDFGLALDVQPSDVLFSDVHRWHGTLPRTEGNRIAQVYFVRKDMHKCGVDDGASEITGDEYANLLDEI